MLAEVPLQIDLFTGERVDTRTPAQKQADAERLRPLQLSMFSAAEQVEQTSPARPWLAAFPAPALELAIVDTRTDDEKVRDQMREAEKLTAPLFADTPIVEPPSTDVPAVEQIQTTEIDIPILWTSRADMLTRRPDLADKLNRLHDDELEDLAGLVGEALKEFYWVQLNVVLALYLDHELHLTRMVKKRLSIPPSPTSSPSTRILPTHCP